MQTLTFDSFLRSLKQNLDSPHSLLLGAGASVESGIPSASDCIWEWKKEIFLSQNTALVDMYSNIKADNVRHSIQRWLDEQRTYPKFNDDSEYSFYAEMAYPIANDRKKYFQHLVEGRHPSLGYHLVCMLSELGIFKSIWTTNFDGLVLKCAHQYNLTPIEITLESVDRIYRNDTSKELLYIALHGDYKYGELKNTAKELDSQNDKLIQALKRELANHDLIVLGYSGRDKSLMAALHSAFTENGSGKLFWCGYGAYPQHTVEELLDNITSTGREAYYVPTDGFDKTFYSISRHCFSNNKELLAKIEQLKKHLSSTVDAATKKFNMEKTIPNKIADTNLFPFAFPKTCFQFEASYVVNESPWDYCKSLMSSKIIAVPLNGVIYAWGEKEQIINVCCDRLKSEISITPFSKETIFSNGVFKELLLRTITALLGENSALSFSKNKVWDINQKFIRRVGGSKITAFCGVRISVQFDNKFSYISLVPTFVFEQGQDITRDVRKQFSDAFSSYINAGKSNPNIHNYINTWADKLFGKSGTDLSFPLNSFTGFDFKIRRNSAILGINYGSKAMVRLPNSISDKRIVFNGIECRDPELNFYNIQRNNIIADFHPMRGLVNNSPFDYILNDKLLHSSISIGIICPDTHNKQFSDFINQLNCRQNVKFNIDFVIPFPGFYQAFKSGLEIPVIGSNKWLNLIAPVTQDVKKASVELGECITQKLNQLDSNAVDVVLIYIPKEYEIFTGYSDEESKFDLHDYVKAYAAQRSIATQFIREKTIESDMHCQIMWAIALALYVKSGRIPWTISGIQKDTAFAGIGYSVQKSPNGTNIVVGCSHIYSHDGQGMKYKLSKIEEEAVVFDRKKNPYLTENEAYRLGLSIKELFYKSFTEFPNRVVIHKRTHFTPDEIKGLTESLNSAGIRDIELLEITYSDNIECFEYDRMTKMMDGYPVRRGLCFPMNDTTMYLFTHGIAPSVRNPNYKYIQGGKTLPLPLKIVKHYGNGSMTQIATEILGLSKMHWNSFGLYSKLPCTIESSNEIAKIGWLLSQYEGTIYDYRYFM